MKIFTILVCLISFSLVGCKTEVVDQNDSVVTSPLAPQCEMATTGSYPIMKNMPRQMFFTYNVSSMGIAFVQTHVLHIGVDPAYQVTSVEIFDEDGYLVAGPFDAVPDGAMQKVTFTDTIMYQAGVHAYFVSARFASTTPAKTEVWSATNIGADWSGITSLTSAPALLALDAPCIRGIVQ